ncbi:hypothetical protein EVAR_59853_1 [Eumeta japonica]|uniref:Uncharacterized protein n=1 Tax=Eumeta variegata TaxID=151549 RepID=A0A4C1ZAZ6_EUMVA|nr:hypothetical protein EVAR_59853_1 [Eumeta japonica]
MHSGANESASRAGIEARPARPAVARGRRARPAVKSLPSHDAPGAGNHSPFIAPAGSPAPPAPLPTAAAPVAELSDRFVYGPPCNGNFAMPSTATVIYIHFWSVSTR